MEHFVKKPCKHCPYRRDVKPYLTPQRGLELAYHAQNPYNSFPCHKTTVSDDEFGGDGTEMVAVETSKECAGFLSLVFFETGVKPEGFEPSDLCYSDVWEMEDAYSGEDS